MNDRNFDASEVSAICQQLDYWGGERHTGRRHAANPHARGGLHSPLKHHALHELHAKHIQWFMHGRRARQRKQHSRRNDTRNAEHAPTRKAKERKTTMNFKDVLESLPDTAFVPVGWIREQLAIEPERVSWVGTARASEILDEPERRVRRLAVRWERVAAAGRRPEVRVCRKSGAVHSHLLLCEEDCWELRRAKGAVVLETGTDVPNLGTPEAEDEAIADEIVRQHFG
jgi:hypothetical protein